MRAHQYDVNRDGGFSWLFLRPYFSPFFYSVSSFMLRALCIVRPTTLDVRTYLFYNFQLCTAFNNASIYWSQSNILDMNGVLLMQYAVYGVLYVKYFVCLFRELSTIFLHILCLFSILRIIFCIKIDCNV